jgi:hypothetical protein
MQRSAGSAGSTPSVDFMPNAQQGKKPITVWVKTGEKIHRVRIATGAIDGSNAEVKYGLKEGDLVILSMTLPGKSGSASTTAASPSTTTSPFMPQRPATRGR